mgnify:CR=1 FL=1|tara:strand:- start:1258 stop:1578 length:321 start_codon:yes stop_codon:yes gene_type:complete
MNEQTILKITKAVVKNGFFFSITDDWEQDLVLMEISASENEKEVLSCYRDTDIIRINIHKPILNLDNHTAPYVVGFVSWDNDDMSVQDYIVPEEMKADMEKIVVAS